MTDQLTVSIVRIFTAGETVVGAGFLVTERQVLTCAHVVAQALGLSHDTPDTPQAKVHLDFPLVTPGLFLTARVIHWQPLRSDGGGDIAGLELEGDLPLGVQAARLVRADDLWGHPFRVFGSPAGYDDGVWASGLLRGRQATGWVQIEDVKEAGYRVQPGFSGAPVWDEELDGVAGMAVAAEGRPEIKAAFIIPTDVLVEAWSALGERAILACPYRGLFAFREQDAPFFFGREAFTDRLVEAVQRQAMVAVIGPSGSGKSSVVFAGLLPRLRHEADWLFASFRPGERPFHATAAVLLPLLEPHMSETDRLLEIGKLAEALSQGDLGLPEVVARILQKSLEARHLLLVADQFEELYTLCSEPEVRQCFLERLLETVEAWRDRRGVFGVGDLSSARLVLTLRADFLGQALAYRPLADALQDANLILGPMTHQELRRAIENPAEKLGVAFEAGLTERILDDVGDEPGNLPLLEFALTSLWKRQAGGRLTHAAYQAIGRVEGALSRHAEEVYNGLSQAEQEGGRRTFVQLVCPGERMEDTRRLATRAELGEEGWRLVRRLADARLVVTDQDPAGQETVELVHEALIRGWGRLRAWIEEDRAFRIWQERLRAALRQWEASARDEGALLHGMPLAQAEGWLAERPDDLNPDERGYIQESVALRKREQAAQKRGRALLSIGRGLLGATLGGLVGESISFISENGFAEGIIGHTLGGGILAALFGGGISFGINLGGVLGPRSRILPLVGGIVAGMLLGAPLGLLLGESPDTQMSFVVLGVLGALFGAMYGGGIALSTTVGERFMVGRRIPAWALIGLMGALVGGLIGLAFENSILSAFVGFGIAVGIGIVDDRSQPKAV
jgi:hypothetical protein